MSLKGRKPHSNRSVPYCRMFKNPRFGPACKYNKSPQTCNITSHQNTPGRSGGRGESLCDSHRPQASPEPCGRPLLTAQGGSGSPHAGLPGLLSGRTTRATGPRPSIPSRVPGPAVRPRVPTPPGPRSLFILDAEADDTPSPTRGGEERGRKGRPLASTSRRQGREPGPPR